MKRLTVIAAAAAGLIVSATPALSQEGGMKMDGMQGMGMKDMPCCEGMAHGFGVVNSIDLEARKINLTHEPIPEFGWGVMTMDFAVGEKVDLGKLKKGDNIHFMLKQARDGSYRIPMACRIDGDPEAYKASMRKMMEEGMKKDDMAMKGMAMDDMKDMSCMGGEKESGAQDETHH